MSSGRNGSMARWICDWTLDGAHTQHLSVALTRLEEALAVQRLWLWEGRLWNAF